MRHEAVAVCVQNKVFRAPSSDIWVQTPVPRVSQAVQKGLCKPDKLGILCSTLNLQCSKGLKKVRSHLPEFSLFPAMIPQHFSDFQGFGGEKKQCVKQLPNLLMQPVESTGNFDVKFMN